MFGYQPIQPTTLITEGDDDLRARLHYVAGGSHEPHVGERLNRAHGPRLDELAAALGLRRRRM